MFLERKKLEEGVSLYLAIIIMSILLAIVLGVSAILYSQLRITNEVGSSVVAFYAADSGIERAMYDENNCLLVTDIRHCGSFYRSNPCSGDGNGDGFCDGVAKNYDTGEVILDSKRTVGYKVKAVVIGQKRGFRSIGKFYRLNRAIEIQY